MRAFSILITSTAVLAACLVLYYLALPVLGDINGGQLASAKGTGAASAAIMYVLLTPVLFTISRGPVARLVSVGIATLSAYVVRTWVTMVEQGQIEAALLVMLLVGFALTVTYFVMRLLDRQRREKVSMLARALSTTTADVTDQLRRRYGGSPDNHRMDGPIHQVAFIDRLVFSLIAEAATETDVSSFVEVMQDGLVEIRESSANVRTDPNGYGAIAAAEYCVRLGNELRRRVGSAAPMPRANPMVAGGHPAR
jgi:ABC-type multidrug transport system fused ATPase/permease subunit